MVRRLTALLLVTGWVTLASMSARAQGTEAERPAAAPDYALPASWVCRPGREEVCTTGLDARVIDPDGHSEVQPFVPAKAPAIDCFYVYPTVSREQRDYADLADSPEIQAVTRSQVGRLSSRCRVFAPIYRQATLQHLRERLGGGGDFLNERYPQDDVAAAWEWYLQHENHGRGVVLIGHSQGTLLLQQLMQTSIDRTPARSLLVSAFLAGDPSLGVPAGKRVGGTFATIPVCSRAAETGCAYPWGSFLEDSTSEAPVFGAVRKDGLVSACANPAAPEGGVGVLKPYFPKPPNGPEVGAPFVEPARMLTGGCQEMHGAHVFSVQVRSAPGAALWRAVLTRAQSRPSWGLHVLDLTLVEGNILDVLDAETATWQAAHPALR